jgi:hypothetical protein
MRTLQAAMPQSSHYPLPQPVQPSDLPVSTHSVPGSALDLSSLPFSSSPSSPPPSHSHVHPHHLDRPFFYSHLSSDPELWFDWMSDCGDGFNPSYQVARMLAQPSLRVHLRRRSSNVPGLLQLPRAKLLLLGGDLAYPSPTPDSYETRFFRAFQCALPPPLSYDPAAISVQKPLGGLDGLRSYDGPQCFAIPGNHDCQSTPHLTPSLSLSLTHLPPSSLQGSTVYKPSSATSVVVTGSVVGSSPKRRVGSPYNSLTVGGSLHSTTRSTTTSILHSSSTSPV